MVLTTCADAVPVEKAKAIAETIDGPEKYASFMLGGGPEGGKCESAIIYEKLMRQYFLQEFNLVLPDLVKKWSKQCWTCGKTEALKTCSSCKWAKYCGRSCQAKGRQMDKMMDYEIALFYKKLKNSLPV